MESLKTSLHITELFTSVQGETSFAGLPTAFIRLATCNLRCSWCDTAYSFSRGTPRFLQEIVHWVESVGCRHVCVTGGEPLLQDAVHPLMTALCDKGYIVNLETGGSLSIAQVDPRAHIILDIKCPGSKMEKKNDWENLHRVKFKDEIKFVLADRNDYDFAKKICHSHQCFEKVSSVLFSPVHGILDPKVLVEWMISDKIPARLNLQIHKYVWSPETRGV